jgi:hypothetical protein
MSRYDDIITALTERLAEIRTAVGYRTDAGERVFINLEYKTAPKEVPCLIFFPGEVTDTLDGDTPPSQGEENHYLPVTIEGWIADDETGAQGQALRQDILQALKTDPYFGGLTEGYSGAINSSAEIEDGGEEGFLGFAQVTATIFYVTAYGEQ